MTPVPGADDDQPRRRQGLTFGEVAEDFDRVRLTYPAPLVDDVLAYAGNHGPALEVGAGTGKATLAMLERGVAVVALEPDPAMAAILARRCADRPGVTIVPSTFEEYQPPAARFTLLFSADAWHWTDPASRWELATNALAPGGAIAMFWNYGQVQNSSVRQRMQVEYDRHGVAGIMDYDPVAEPDLFSVWPGDEFAASGRFVDLVGRVYPGRVTLSAEEYLTLQETRSSCRMLSEPVRRDLFAALARCCPERVTLAVHTTLFLGRRNEDS
jgi:SAM-dependent methyltransferase